MRLAVDYDMDDDDYEDSEEVPREKKLTYREYEKNLRKSGSFDGVVKLWYNNSAVDGINGLVSIINTEMFIHGTTVEQWLEKAKVYSAETTELRLNVSDIVLVMANKILKSGIELTGDEIKDLGRLCDNWNASHAKSWWKKGNVLIDVRREIEEIFNSDDEALYDI